MTIYIYDWLMIGNSPEYAERMLTRTGSWWRLSWLPDRFLTFEQAYAGMEVDEILADPALVNDEAALAHAARGVQQLGLVWEQVVVFLYGREEGRALEERVLCGALSGSGIPDDPGAVRSGSAA